MAHDANPRRWRVTAKGRLDVGILCSSYKHDLWRCPLYGPIRLLLMTMLGTVVHVDSRYWPAIVVGILDDGIFSSLQHSCCHQELGLQMLLLYAPVLFPSSVGVLVNVAELRYWPGLVRDTLDDAMDSCLRWFDSEPDLDG